MNDYAFQFYKQNQTRNYQEQEPVFVWLKSDRSTGAAVVQQTPDSLPTDSPYAGRYLVHFNTGQTAHVRPERLLPVFTQPKLILVTAATEDYRRLARSQVSSSDVVLELGCSYGMCTNMLAEHAAHVIGIDNSEEAVAEARQRYPHVRFEVADVLDQTAAVLDIACGCSCSNGHTADDAAGGSSCGNGSSSSSKQKCDVVFADIGGNRQLEALLRLLPWVLQQLEPRLLVVKSEELAEAAERQLLQQQTQQQVEEHARLSQHQLQTRQLDSRQLSARGLQLQQDLQQLQGQLQAATVTGSAAGSRVVAAAAFCDSSTSSLSIGAAADSCQQPHSQQHLQQQQESAAAAARGQILNPQAWWDWLEVQCGLNPLLHSGRAEAWYLEARGKGFVRNPLRYPQRFTADGTRICRPHNYDKCLKIDTCRFDHQHCHHCGAAGHTAVDCHIVT